MPALNSVLNSYGKGRVECRNTRYLHNPTYIQDNACKKIHVTNKDKSMNDPILLKK